MKALFIEAPGFTRVLATYLDDDEYAALEDSLAENPEAGAVIPGTGGFRKVRWRDSRRGKGKRGGLRVVYYWFADDREIWFVTIYDKDEAGDLSAEAKKAMRLALAAERELRAKRSGGNR